MYFLGARRSAELPQDEGELKVRKKNKTKNKTKMDENIKNTRTT
jgi:hypothetical protein